MRLRLILPSLFLVSLTLPLSSCCTHVSCFKRSASWIWPIERSEIITAEEEAARIAAEERMIAHAKKEQEGKKKDAVLVAQDNPQGLFKSMSLQNPASEAEFLENMDVSTEISQPPKRIETPVKAAFKTPEIPVVQKQERLIITETVRDKNITEILVIEPAAGDKKSSEPMKTEPAFAPVALHTMSANDFRAMAAQQMAAPNAPKTSIETPLVEQTQKGDALQAIEPAAATLKEDAEQKLAVNNTVPAMIAPPPSKPTASQKNIGVLPLCSDLAVLDYDKDENISFKKLVAGYNGWLFRTRFDLKQDFEFNDKSIEAFKRLNRAFNYNGTQVVLMVIPTRGLIGAKNLLPPLNQSFNKDAAMASYVTMLERMRQSGMTVADMSTVDTVNNYFLTRDNHWTAEGARYSAFKTAKAIRNMPLYKTLKKTKFQTISSQPDKENAQANDRFMDFIERVCGTPMPREYLEARYLTMPKESIVSEASLFNDKDAPEIVLLGTSQSTQPDPSYANFIGFLKEYLSVDITNESIAGGSFHGSIANYVLSGDYARNKPKLIIWELGGHYGFEQKRTFREVIPALYGQCSDKDALASYVGEAGDTDSLTLFDNLEGKNINSKDYYLSLKLHDNEMRAIKVFLTSTDGKKKQIKFERKLNNFPEHNGVFYTDFREIGSATLQSIALNVNGRTYGPVRAKICKIPR